MTDTLHIPASIGAFQICSSESITGDASCRRYWRVVLEQGGTAILCRYPGPWRSVVKRDLEVLKWLGERNLPVPQILAGDAQNLWVLLEDLGPVDGEQALVETPSAARIERTIPLVDPLIRLAALPVRQLPPWNPSLDQAFLRWELTGFEMWSLSTATRHTAHRTLQPWFDKLAAVVAGHPQAICFRDFHLNNILLNTDGRVGVIDVQDLRRGPDTYDLASLLGDRAMPDLLTADQRQTIAEYWAEGVGATPGWQHRLEVTTLQRALKVLGTFAFLSARGLPHYQRWIPKTASAAAGLARNCGAPAEAITILLELAATGGSDVW